MKIYKKAWLSVYESHGFFVSTLGMSIALTGASPE